MAEWMPDVEHIESRARGGAIEPRGVMSHIMQGSQATMIRWAEERGAITPISSHFTIGKDGRVAQHAAIRTQAWHAGRLDAARPPTWRLLPPGGNPNDFAVGIEHEGFSGEPWPEPQIAATLRVHRWLFEELGLIPSEDTVIGHFMTAPASRAHDPGSGWPRDRILEVLHAQHSTAERAAAELGVEERLVAAGAGAEGAAVDSEPVVPPPAALRLPQGEYETAALNAFFEVLGHSYSVREDELWQYIEIRRPRPRPL
jgi:N-acetyl-anhydromuramyl-L-alanine amidase AmpD